MYFLLVAAMLLLTIGHLWFAWMLWTSDQLFLAIALLLIPMPLVGLFAWYQSDWDPSYKVPAIIYFAGYALVSLVGMASP